MVQKTKQKTSRTLEYRSTETSEGNPDFEFTLLLSV